MTMPSYQPPPSTGPFDPPELRSLLAVLAADLEGLSWRGSPAGPLHVAGYASGQMGADRAADAAATLGWRIAVPPERDYVEGGVRLSLTLMPPAPTAGRASPPRSSPSTSPHSSGKPTTPTKPGRPAQHES